MTRLKTILSVFRHLDYEVYSRPLELNIVGVRSDSVIPNAFDDRIAVFFRGENGKRWNYLEFPATTDPGTYWLKNPPATINSQGLKATAIMEQGQYVGAYRIGLHRGKYEALVQRGGPVQVVRDYNRDSVLDFFSGVSERGYFGINIHAPSLRGGADPQTVDRDSAGCQVLARMQDFQLLMQFAGEHAARYGNHFTYTLIDLRSMRKSRWRRRVVAGAILTTSALGLYSLWRIFN